MKPWIILSIVPFLFVGCGDGPKDGEGDGPPPIEWPTLSKVDEAIIATRQDASKRADLDAALTTLVEGDIPKEVVVLEEVNVHMESMVQFHKEFAGAASDKKLSNDEYLDTLHLLVEELMCAAGMPHEHHDHEHDDEHADHDHDHDHDDDHGHDEDHDHEKDGDKAP